MISIVVCSTSEILDPILSKNISDTIGDIKYEIIWIDNSKNNYSIFQAYNLGILKSKYGIICFAHQDIEFLTPNWGKIIVDSFCNDKVGLCGVVGSKYISQKPFGWWCSYSRRGRISELINNSTILRNYGAIYNEKVSTIDGLCMFFRKSLFPLIKFDEYTYSGFHFYDMDICMQFLLKNYLILLVPVDILHKSVGYANLQFYKNYLKFTYKYRANLPFFVDMSIKDSAKELNFYNGYVPVNVYENIILSYERVFYCLDILGQLFHINNILSILCFSMLSYTYLLIRKIKRHLHL